MTRHSFILAVLALLPIAGPAAADTRYFAYEADSPTARHRSGDLTVVVDRPLFGGARPRGLYRRRGADLPLSGAERSFGEAALAGAVGGPAAGLRAYRVEGDAAQGFSQGACGAAQPVWIALPEPRRFQPLRLHVLRREANGAPALCETLEYRWRAEWDVPDRRGLPDEDPRPSARPF